MRQAVLPNTRRLASSLLLALVWGGDTWSSDAVEVYAAGSLRGVVTELSHEVQGKFGTEVKGTFGGSGSLRERIEAGEKPDLFLSADLASPRKLAAGGRTEVPVIPFARNRMCIVSRTSSGLTANNLVKRLLDPAVRVKTSAPVVDPGGDYAWAMFDKVDARHPGAGATLKRKAQDQMTITAPATPGQSPQAALFTSGKIDVSVTYCSGAMTLQQEVPQLSSLPVPSEFEPHPLYGIAVLSSKPEAWRLALFLLSQDGQSIIAHNGLIPILDTPASP